MESIHLESTLSIPWNFVNTDYGEVLTTSKKTRAFMHWRILILTLGHLAFCHINVDVVCNNQTNLQKLVTSAITWTVRPNISNTSDQCWWNSGLQLGPDQYGTHSILSNWRTGELNCQLWKSYYIPKPSDLLSNTIPAKLSELQQKLNKLLDITGMTFLWDMQHLQLAYWILCYMLWLLCSILLALLSVCLCIHVYCLSRHVESMYHQLVPD